MYLKIFTSIFIISALLFISCGPQKAEVEHNTTSSAEKSAGIKYAERFAIRKEQDYTLVYLFGNRETMDTTATYLIAPDSTVLKTFKRPATFIKNSWGKIVALSSIYANILYELNALNRLVAIDNSDYVINPHIISKFANGGLQELSKGPELDLEKTIALKPNLIFTFGMGDPGKDIHAKLAQSGIPTVVSVDHLEKTPLARAEWIKFYAAFIGHEKLADSLFQRTEQNYLALQRSVKKSDHRPHVFNELKYGDSWYVPGGKSYMARLLSDAGADYIWKNDSTFGSFPLSFEQVYAKARHADFWINLSLVKTKAELLGYESRYAQFKAFKTGHLYNNNKVTNTKGYSTYWETGMIHPDRILSDLIVIFHSDSLSKAKNDLYYYQQIK